MDICHPTSYTCTGIGGLLYLHSSKLYQSKALPGHLQPPHIGGVGGSDTCLPHYYEWPLNLFPVTSACAVESHWLHTVDNKIHISISQKV